MESHDSTAWLWIHSAFSADVPKHEREVSGKNTKVAGGIVLDFLLSQISCPQNAENSSCFYITSEWGNQAAYGQLSGFHLWDETGPSFFLMSPKTTSRSTLAKFKSQASVYHNRPWQQLSTFSPTSSSHLPVLAADEYLFLFNISQPEPYRWRRWL